MKKLLSIFAISTIISPGIVAVASCSVPTSSVSTLVDGKEKFKIKSGDDIKEISSIDLFSNEKSKMLSIFTMQILEALTFSETKYQSSEKLNAKKKSLGINGLNLSLEKLINESFTEENNLPKFTDNTNGSFKEAYFSTNDTKFLSVNYNMNINLSEDALDENGKWESELASTYTGDYSKVMKADANFNSDGKLENIEKSDKDENKRLDYFLNLTWSQAYEDLFKSSNLESFKDKGVYTLEESQANELYEVLKNLTDPVAQELISIDKDVFKTIHSQLRTVKTKLKNGILMLSKFDESLVNNDKETKIIPYEKDSEGNQTNKTEFFNLQEGWEFFENSSKNLQSNETLIYAKADVENIPEINFEFDSQNSKGDKFNIKISGLNNLIVGFSLMGAKIGQTTNEDKSKKDEMIYWYEPVVYQFNKTTMFKAGIENMFETLDTKKVNIIVEKNNLT
ncbi:hypothetical protein [Spiroplasma taiwanense]|uniref:Lipoprotein n=1 Tax=Spiroplasma taiwanense CT-1 TaxID=1276220 RepID=S5MAE8_9MOLU|nr:hypothetical protein [Spiroplasma taiwanense]AGR40723.1 hypothetical protein STAIW_v1c00260 [Spiroplasma taiwanense CT-1]